MTDTKPDLSLEVDRYSPSGAHRMQVDDVGAYVSWDDYRALLDAKEAAEVGADRAYESLKRMDAQLTESRASVAAAWEAGRDAAADRADHKIVQRGQYELSQSVHDAILAIPNPYSKPKE